MFILGITGGIGCGKSTAAQVCHQAGLPVIDADELSRQVTAPDGKALPEIVELFGSSVLDEAGALNRDAVARRVFRDHRSLDALSRIVHRHVLALMKEQVEALDQKKERAVVLDVPIPVKEGFLDLCDQVWVVWASEANRLERLAARGMQAEEARRRIDMQMSRDEYLALADQVLENDGTLQELEDQVRSLLRQELGQRGIRIKEPDPVSDADT